MSSTGNHKESEPETVLRVGSASPAGTVAAAISHAVYDGKKPVLRCIGASAVNQGVKAVAIAQGYVGQRGLTLTMRPGFTTITMPDGSEVSAIIMKVIAD